MSLPAATPAPRGLAQCSCPQNTASANSTQCPALPQSLLLASTSSNLTCPQVGSWGPRLSLALCALGRQDKGQSCWAPTPVQPLPTGPATPAPANPPGSSRAGSFRGGSTGSLEKLGAGRAALNLVWGRRQCRPCRGQGSWVLLPLLPAADVSAPDAPRGVLGRQLRKKVLTPARFPECSGRWRLSHTPVQPPASTLRGRSTQQGPARSL